MEGRKKETYVPRALLRRDKAGPSVFKVNGFHLTIMDSQEDQHRDLFEGVFTTTKNGTELLKCKIIESI